MIASGRRRHLVTLGNPVMLEPDGDGGYVETMDMLNPPAVYAEILMASGHSLERIFSNTVVSTATHVITLPYHPEVTTKTVVTFNGRTFNVTGVANPEERNIETICACVEVVP